MRGRPPRLFGFVVEQMRDAQLNQLLQGQVRKPMLLCQGDERRIDVEDAALYQVLGLGVRELLLDLASSEERHVLYAHRKQLIRVQSAKARSFHAGDEFRCYLEDAIRNGVLKALDINAILLEFGDGRSEEH